MSSLVLPIPTLVCIPKASMPMIMNLSEQLLALEVGCYCWCFRNSATSWGKGWELKSTNIFMEKGFSTIQTGGLVGWEWDFWSINFCRSGLGLRGLIFIWKPPEESTWNDIPILTKTHIGPLGFSAMNVPCINGISTTVCHTSQSHPRWTKTTKNKKSIRKG